ncbi:MAG: hypothetical protein P8L85_21305 [Rubripirellula sp.]|nr:hypothetical protein [Rubripirellula sp.]
MKLNPKIPLWLAFPLMFAAAHAILVLASVLLLMTPFSALGSLLYQWLLLADILVLSRFWDGEITTVLVLGSLQWAAIGLLVAIVRRQIGGAD